MDSLVQRLKEMDANTFQQLCFQLMAEKYPSASIRNVEGASGDEGVDIFCGELACGPTIWQCKCFQSTLVGDSQKEHIRKSLRAAVGRPSPRCWVLCLNLDLDIKGHRWFQRLTDSYNSKGLTIELIQGSDIVRELIFRHTLRGHFFPDAQILDEVRRLVPRSDKLRENELDLAPGEDIEQFIERLRARDPRFFYEVTVGGERGADVFPPHPEPKLISAVTDGRKTIKAFAWDDKALSLDPVGFSMTIAESGKEKLDSFARTGHSQQLDAEEIFDFNSSVPLISDLGLVPGRFGLSLNSLLPNQPIPLRLSIIGETERVIYELLEFDILRAGTDEVEISTKRGDLPFEIRFVFPTPRMRTTKGKVHLKKLFAGKDIRQVRKALAVFGLLEAGIDIELYSLRDEKILAVVGLSPFKFDSTLPSRIWTDMLCCISEKFGVTICIPETAVASQKDEETIRHLYALASGGTLQFDEILTNLVKTVENSSLFPAGFSRAFPIRIMYESTNFMLFGSEIRVGPWALVVSSAEFMHIDQILRDFERAKIGEGVAVSIHPLAPVRVLLMPNETALPTQM